MGQSSENPCESLERPGYEAATSSACLDLALAGASVEKIMVHGKHESFQRTRPEARGRECTAGDVSYKQEARWTYRPGAQPGAPRSYQGTEGTLELP